MLNCWDADPEQRPTFAQLVTTITSALDTLADYLHVTTFVTGEEQDTEETIMESKTVDNEEEASQEETHPDPQGGQVKGANKKRATKENTDIQNVNPWIFTGQTITTWSMHCNYGSLYTSSMIH